MAFDFLISKHLIIGEGALEKGLNEIGKSFQGRKVLIVSDPIIKKIGILERIITHLGKRDINAFVFDDIQNEPSDVMVNQGLKEYKKNSCEFLLSIGGGSAIDTMKAIGVLASNGGEIADYFTNEIKNDPPFMIAIPTTSGTGSEVTKFTIIHDTKSDAKLLITSSKILPTMAIIDPELTKTMPISVTVNTGIDALCHAIESYTSRKANSISQVFSVSAIKRIVHYLPLACLDGNDLKARQEMSLASLEAGIAFSNSSVTLIHGMSRPIGAKFQIPHGHSNAVLLIPCLKYLMQGQESVFGKLSKECGIAKDDDDLKTACQKLFKLIEEMVENCKIRTLKDSGVVEEIFMKEIYNMARDAMDSGSPQNSLRSCDESDIVEIYKDLF